MKGGMGFEGRPGLPGLPGMNGQKGENGEPGNHMIKDKSINMRMLIYQFEIISIKIVIQLNFSRDNILILRLSRNERQSWLSRS